MTFKDEHPEFQQFARELGLLLGHNGAVFDGLTPLPLRLFPQLALAFVALERFLRILPGVQVRPEEDTLSNLLERASGRRLRLLDLHDRAQTTTRVNETRVAFMHGRLGAAVDEREAMLSLACFANDMVRFIDQILVQVDVRSGARASSVTPAVLATSSEALPVDASFLSPAEELEQLRLHNKGAAAHGQHEVLFLLAEGALTVMLLERTCRLALAAGVSDDDGFRLVLERAVLGPDPCFRLEAGDPGDAVARIVDVRNTLVHANYEQALTAVGLTTVPEYFGSSQYIAEVETLYKISRMFERQRLERGMR